MRQIGLAFHNYHDTHSRFPQPSMIGLTVSSGLIIRSGSSWCTMLLPYMEQGNVYSTLAYTGQTPAAAREGWGTWSLSVQDPGMGALSSGGKGGSLRDFTDGTSNAILVGEVCARTALYRKGRLIPTSDPVAAAQAIVGSGMWADLFKGDTRVSGVLFDGTGTDGPCAINCANSRTAGLYSWHTGGAHIALADGSARFISENVSAYILASLITKAGGEVIGEF